MSAKLRFATFSGLFGLVALCLLLAQDDPVKQKAIDQMRQVAKAMKQCAEQQIGSYQSECHVVHMYAGPPTNLEWDVLPSKTVRSPFQGIVEFTLPTRSENIDPPNQSSKDHQKCIDRDAQLDAMGIQAEIADEVAKKGPEWREGHYRYEFDVGSDTPELVKTVWVVKDRSNNVLTSPINKSGLGCWLTAAKSIGPTKTENPAHKP